MYRAAILSTFLMGLVVTALIDMPEATSGLPNRHAIVDHFDLMDLNHCVRPGAEDKAELTQVIFWDWNAEYRRYEVQAWVLTQRTYVWNFDMPYKRSDGRWEVRFKDGTTNRIVICKLFRETHTNFDPDIANKKLFPEKQRRGFTKPQQ